MDVSKNVYSIKTTSETPSILKQFFSTWNILKVGGSAPPQPGVEIPTGAFVAKITNDAREEEMEENMQQVRQRTAVFVFEIYWEVSSTTVENEVLLQMF